MLCWLSQPLMSCLHLLPHRTFLFIFMCCEDHILATTLLIAHRASSPAGARDEDGMYAGCNDWGGGYLGTCI